MSGRLLIGAKTFVVLLTLAAPAAEPPKSFEVVARGAARVSDGQKETGAVEAGEVLTVLATDQDKYWVQSPRGIKGWIQRDGVVSLDSAEPIYSQLIQANPGNPLNYLKNSNEHKKTSKNIPSRKPSKV